MQGFQVLFCFVLFSKINFQFLFSTKYCHTSWITTVSPYAFLSSLCSGPYSVDRVEWCSGMFIGSLHATLKASFTPMIQCHEAGKGHASTFHPEHTRLALRKCALPASIHALRGLSFSSFLITCPSAKPQRKTKSSLRRFSSSNSNPHNLPLVLSM